MNAKEYIGQAQREKNPQARARILRDAAVDYAQRVKGASSPRERDRLTAIGLQFAGAAQRVFEPTVAGINHDSSVDARAFHALENLYPEGIDEALSTGEGPSIKTPDRVSVSPSTFTDETALGRVVDITYNPTPQQQASGIKSRETVALWQGKKTEAQAMSVDLGLVIPPAVLAAGISGIGTTAPIGVRMYADIQYGVDGNTQILVRVDFGLGRKINLVANYISVAIGMEKPGDAESDPPPVISAGASIGQFSSSCQAPVIRTVYLDKEDFTGSSPNLFSNPKLIPARAVRLLPMMIASSTPDTDTLDVRFLDFGGEYICDIPFTISNALRPVNAIPIPPDAFSFVVQKKTPFQTDATAGLRVPFELSL